MKKEWSIVDVLRHSRHDWLNKIQLIKGNVALHKYDRVKEIIDEIVMETQNESKLTNLHLDKLSTYLMTFNWEKHPFMLEYEVIGEAGDLSSYDVALLCWCESLFNLLDATVDLLGENQLSITIEILREEVRFFFDFRGIIKDREILLNWFEEKQQESIIQLTEYAIHNEEITASINVKLPN